MKTSSTKKKRPTTRAGRRGMTLAEWHRQNQWPTFIDGQTSLRLTDWQTSLRLTDWQTNRLADDSLGKSSQAKVLSASLNSLKVCQSISLKKEVCQFKKDSYGRICGLHPEDAALIAQLWEESRHRGIRFSTLAALYFPNAESLNAAKARLCYELRCCRGLSEALERLHHPKKFCRFTCAQVRAIFLLYGSPGA